MKDVYLWRFQHYITPFKLTDIYLLLYWCVCCSAGGESVWDRLPAEPSAAGGAVRREEADQGPVPVRRHRYRLVDTGQPTLDSGSADTGQEVMDTGHPTLDSRHWTADQQTLDSGSVDTGQRINRHWTEDQ